MLAIQIAMRGMHGYKLLRNNESAAFHQAADSLFLYRFLHQNL